VSVPLFNAVARGVPIKVVAPLGVNPEGNDRGPVVMMVRKDLYDAGTVRQVGQLRGRKVAITGLGSDNHWSLGRLLQEAGLRLEDVEVVAMPFPDMVTAMRTGNVDAAILASPFDVRAEEEGVAVALVPNVSPGQMVTVLMFGPQFVQDRPEVARRFMAAYLDAIRLIQREGLLAPANLAIFEQQLGLDAETLRKSRAPTYDPQLRTRADTLLQFQQFLLANGMLTYDAPLGEAQLVDRRFADSAVQQAR
jgi:NitT/TauT family transport system substrate-binding protein